ncbi:protein kinase domain-containing protein [Rickettsiella endosymbiont of Dermanyssus gallinae]|uniref:protein kinase domain-containing protein n=1 Tax=Rickettsiella endosymbiont of Dermanyssus gallinae TaxID=2856608 RepID=UPI001C533FD7|nr:AarF/UbiB family protein [Rickettsiella endosymbiont of Dermanyssus gallinae]
MSLIYVINPQTDPKVKEADLLLMELLKSMTPGDVYKKDTSVPIVFQGEAYQILLTHEILCRKRQYKQGLRYEVIDNNPKGQGAFGQVSSTTTLIVHDDQIERKYKRIIKREIKPENGVDTFSQEAVLGQRVAYLHMKPVVSNSQRNKGAVSEKFLIMHHLPGEPLDKLLKDGSISRLDQFEKLKLSLALLRTLKKEVYDVGLIHSDIKPDNIMVDFKPGNSMPDVYIIDFGLSRVGPGESRGHNLLYSAPESVAGYSGKESDTFAMGGIIQSIWQNDYPKFLAAIAKALKNKKLSRENKARAILAIKTQVVIDYGVIDELVKGMLMLSIDQRTPLPTALSEMEAIYCSTKANEKQTQLLSIVYSNKMFMQILGSAAEFKLTDDTVTGYLESINTKLKEETPCMAVLLRCLKSLETEEENKTKDTHLINLQQSVREAICVYMQKTYTLSNVKNKDRIASERRVSDINCLLNYLESYTSEVGLSKKILDWEQSLERGFLGRSALASLVHQAMFKNRSKSDRSSFFRPSNVVRMNKPVGYVPVRFQP